MPGVPYDLHMHSCLSPCGDADMTPANIAGMASLNGVRVAALTDHNTCLNCPAFFAACRYYGVVPIAGMELTTAEEIHMVCLFDTLEAALEFDGFVAAHRMKVRNRPEIFGEQIIMDEDDRVVGQIEELLIPATSLGLSSAVHEVHRHGGVIFPAHIDKQANSLLGILGDFPEQPRFTAVELHDPAHLEEYRKRYPMLETLPILVDSDAHMLEQMPLEPARLHGLDDISGEAPLRRAILDRLDGKA